MDLLLNWLAQGGVVAAAAAVVLRAMRRSPAQARYFFAWAACAVVLGLPAVPLVIAAVSPVLPLVAAPVPPAPVVLAPGAWWTSPALAIGFCIVWSGLSALRLAVAAAALRDARRQCRDCPPARQARLHHWSRARAAGRRTRLVLSAGVRSAAVLGCGRPVIALAPELLDRLGDDDLDRVVMHEWAHVQRHDDLAQLVERIVVVVAGWHPAVWWLRRQLELEREVACDEIAVAATGSAKAYAACLTTLAALRLAPPQSVPALAVISSSGLRRRVVRILASGDAAPARRWRAIAVGCSLALMPLALPVGHVHVVASPAAGIRFSATAPLVIGKAITIPVTATVPDVRRAAFGAGAPASRRVSRDQRATPAEPAHEASSAGAPAARAVDAPIISTAAALPSRSMGWPLAVPAATVAALPAAEAPRNALAEAQAAADGADGLARADERRWPWTAAADAAVAVGRGSQNAGVETAGFFSRMSRRIAGSF